MSLVRCDHAANGPGGLHWENPGDVIEVSDPKVREALIKIEGFSDVEPGDPDYFAEVEPTSKKGKSTPPPPPAPITELDPPTAAALAEAGAQDDEIVKIHGLVTQEVEGIAERIASAVTAGGDAVKNELDKLREEFGFGEAPPAT